MSSVLITGGAGFIGTNLTNKLMNDGYEVIIIDDLSSGYREFIHDKAIFIEGSIVNDVALSECFKYKPEYVIHLAALFANQNSVDHPDKDLSVNGLGTIKILEWSKRTAVKKVLYTSSSCVYGNKEVMDEDNENFYPDTPYAITKLLGERYANFWATHHKLDVVSVRLFNVYGPGDFPGAYRSVVPNFIKLAMHGKPLVITGTGNETRDFCYVDDTVNGICKVLFNKTNPGDVFNIATGRKTSIIEIANNINLYCNNTAEIIFQERRNWDCVIHRQAKIDKITSLLGFSAKTELDKGIKKTCDWIIKNTK
jgi:nucleoside-diphosphate-sugar epimerase